jgi:hypothetical protein
LFAAAFLYETQIHLGSRGVSQNTRNFGLPGDQFGDVDGLHGHPAGHVFSEHPVAALNPPNLAGERWLLGGRVTRRRFVLWGQLVAVCLGRGTRHFISMATASSQDDGNDQAVHATVNCYTFVSICHFRFPLTGVVVFRRH